MGSRRLRSSGIVIVLCLLSRLSYNVRLDPSRVMWGRGGLVALSESFVWLEHIQLAEEWA